MDHFTAFGRSILRHPVWIVGESTDVLKVLDGQSFSSSDLVIRGSAGGASLRAHPILNGPTEARDGLKGSEVRRDSRAEDCGQSAALPVRG